MSLTRLSVIIPTCHRNDLLALCLDRLAPGTQTLDAARYEVIVTDDGAAGTAEALVREQYPWAQWVAGPRRGPAANRNNGARQAKHEWLAFTDDDCLPSSHWLEAYAGAIREGVQVYEGRTTCRAGITSPLYESPINLSGGNLWSCNFLAHARLFAEVGGFDEDFTMPSMEDTDLRERLKTRGEPISFVTEALVDHPPRRKPGGRGLARKYEANVRYWYKIGHRGAYLLTYLRHLKHQLHLLRRFRPSRDLWTALAALGVEAGCVLWRLGRWERAFRAYYDAHAEGAGLSLTTTRP